MRALYIASVVVAWLALMAWDARAHDLESPYPAAVWTVTYSPAFRFDEARARGVDLDQIPQTAEILSWVHCREFLYTGRESILIPSMTGIEFVVAGTFRKATCRELPPQAPQ